MHCLSILLKGKVELVIVTAWFCTFDFITIVIFQRSKFACVFVHGLDHKKETDKFDSLDWEQKMKFGKRKRISEELLSGGGLFRLIKLFHLFHGVESCTVFQEKCFERRSLRWPVPCATWFRVRWKIRSRGCRCGAANAEVSLCARVALLGREWSLLISRFSGIGDHWEWLFKDARIARLLRKKLMANGAMFICRRLRACRTLWNSGESTILPTVPWICEFRKC